MFLLKNNPNSSSVRPKPDPSRSSHKASRRTSIQMGGVGNNDTASFLFKTGSLETNRDVVMLDQEWQVNLSRTSVRHARMALLLLPDPP